jgi:TRAP-type uncharacterized transport system substrate-binding protein
MNEKIDLHEKIDLNERIERRIFFRSPIGIASILVTIGVLAWLLFALLQPLPSRNLTMATGPAGSAYARYGEQYRQILARDGVRLRLVPTNGSVENARLLMNPKSGVKVGFVQAGSLEPDKMQDIESLGTVFYEAVWLFCRCTDLDKVRKDPTSWRLSIGPDGSADRPLAQKLLRLNGMDAAGMKLYSYTPAQATDAILQNQIDAVLMLAVTDSPNVARLARAADVHLLSFARADAYVAIEPTLSKFVLPRGVLDLATDEPRTDMTIIASKASLAIRSDLHRALQYLLLQAAIEVHSKASIIRRAGEFPAPEEIDLPISSDTRNMYRSGPSILRRSLPFWLAELVQRLLILVVPLAGVLLPMWTIAIRSYQWRNRRRILRQYRELRNIERELRRSARDDRTRLIARLDEFDRRVLEMRTPVGLSELAYALRAHIQSLRARS